ncbi:hypothetical protein BKA83DRAFT_4129530 [Pisolithus microcarpus]|nr:hypothetical protein BKA83DRAFT_4129530 [Pisolithus microcarpus]
MTIGQPLAIVALCQPMWANPQPPSAYLHLHPPASGSCGFPMGVEIPQLPEWDFSITIMWQWRISNCCGFSMGVEILQVPEWDFSNSLMGGWGFSMGVEILQVPGWDFSNPLMGGWGFSMGVEIPQLLEWDLSIPLMGGWAFSNWAVGHFHGCGDSPTARMGLPYDYYVAVENLQLGSWGFSMWRFPKCKNGISPHLLWGWGFSSWAFLDSP